MSLHGAGAPGNWQRHYFPIFDYKDQNRLVIATPFSPTRVWSTTDDEYLQNPGSAVGDFFHILEQRKSSFIRSARTAGCSQMSCAWTKDTPKVSRPKITAEIVKLMLSARGGKIQQEK